jgi:hypothetical protein
MHQRGLNQPQRVINNKYVYYKRRLQTNPSILGHEDYLVLIFQTVNMSKSLSDSKYCYFCDLMKKINPDIITKADLINIFFDHYNGTTPEGCAEIENNIIKMLDLPIELVVYNLEMVEKAAVRTDRIPLSVWTFRVA